jgi:hypothetical protein
MAGLVAVRPRSSLEHMTQSRAWMAGTSPAMIRRRPYRLPPSLFPLSREWRRLARLTSNAHRHAAVDDLHFAGDELIADQRDCGFSDIVNTAFAT